MNTREYEALVILRAAGSEQEMARQAAQLEEPIKKVSGTLTSSQNMGRRKLAFRISKQAEGYYFLLRFEAPTGALADVERLFRLNESVVRFMILNADEAVPVSAITARQAAPSRGPSAFRS